MDFHFDLDGYHGASGNWTILVPAASAGDLPDRVFGMTLQKEGENYPIGSLSAKHLGSPACEYRVESLAQYLRPAELEQLEDAARLFLEAESAAFAAAAVAASERDSARDSAA